MPDSISIRESTTDDMEAAVAIALAAWAPLHDSLRALLGDEFYETMHTGWQERKAEQVRAAFRGERGSRAAVVEADGRIVGFVTFVTHNGNGVGEIGNNAVHPDCQGQGIGPVMYDYVFRALRDAGVRFVQVGTGGDQFHARARRAYEKAGFSIAYPHVTYYRDLQQP